MPPEDVAVTWEVATDAAFTDVVAQGTEPAVAALAHSVHVTAGGLDANTWYHYRFSVEGHTSATGRTRTTPAAGAMTPLRLGAASCQNWRAGYYTAHAHLAEEGCDLIVFLGDYIYESGGTGPVRAHNGPECKTLTAYRNRYALYKGDPNLQASHASCPWIVIWDDHEVENNYAGLVPQDAADAAGFADRRAMAYQAWWEHTPTRLPAPDPAAADYPIYRSIDIGDLLAISMLDGRQYRSDQVCDATLDVGPPCPGWDDPARSMLGTEQEAWLADRFDSTTSRWNCVAQQTVKTDLRFAGTGGILNYDQWDGYVPARDRSLAGAPADLVVLTGDIHLAGIGLLGDPTGTSPTGVEFVTASISSAANVPADLQPVLAGYPNVVDAELTKRGYTRHTVTADTWTAEYRTVDDVTRADSAVSTWKTFVVDHGSAAVTIQP